MWLPYGGHNATQKLGHFLFGGGPKAVVPPDLAGLRQQSIALLMQLLQPGAFEQGGAGSNFFFGSGPNAVDKFLNGRSTAPLPETSAFDFARPILEGMLTGTGPQFERDVASANQQGGRFGSANAILRGEALRNLFNSRTQTATALGGLADQAGSAGRDAESRQWERLFGAQNQRLQLLAGLLGLSGQATLSLPVQNDKGAFGDLTKLIASLGSGGGGSA